MFDHIVRGASVLEVLSERIRREGLSWLRERARTGQLERDIWITNILFSRKYDIPRLLSIHPVILPPFWDRMISTIHTRELDYEAMLVYQLKYVYNGQLELKVVADHPEVGRGIFVAPHCSLPRGFRLSFWGVIGYQRDEQLDRDTTEHNIHLAKIPEAGIDKPLYAIHPACVAGFVNDARKPLPTSPNCKLWQREYTFRDEWDGFVYLETTRAVGAGEQVLFRYEPWGSRRWGDYTSRTDTVRKE